MPARTARDAVKSFLASTQQAISCITDTVLELRRAGILGAHLPTSFIRLNAFVRLLLTEFEVRPRRPDWVRILGR